MAAPLPSEMPPKLFRLVALLFAKLLLLVPREVLDQVIGGICPIGFQLGGGEFFVLFLYHSRNLLASRLCPRFSRTMSGFVASL